MPTKGQLSKYDIKKEKNRKEGLSIYPFEKKCLKAASYDLTPTIVAMSVKTGMLETVYREKRHIKDKYYIYVHPEDTVLIVSNEYLKVPSNIAGYISSRVSKVVEGFGHISTTIDPNWSGAALIAISNPSKRLLKIYVGKNARPEDDPNQLATVTFHYLNTPCDNNDIEQKQKGMRLDLLKKINYKHRTGVRAFLRSVFYRNRKEFTDYFLSISEGIHTKSFHRKWDKFIEEFSCLKSDSIEKRDFHSKKAQKKARDFIITENFFIRSWHVLERFKGCLYYILLILLIVLSMNNYIPQETLQLIIK